MFDVLFSLSLTLAVQTHFNKLWITFSSFQHLKWALLNRTLTAILVKQLIPFSLTWWHVCPLRSFCGSPALDYSIIKWPECPGTEWADVIWLVRLEAGLDIVTISMFQLCHVCRKNLFIPCLIGFINRGFKDSGRRRQSKKMEVKNETKHFNTSRKLMSAINHGRRPHWLTYQL